MKFIDLFAGLGGFHIALARLGHKCVFACELDEDLRELYNSNFALKPGGDIRGIEATQIPQHDILCAGFPCQPFSKAGEQRGVDCQKWGDLFDHVMRIVRHHSPAYVILENVPNLARHNKGDTWSKMEAKLRAAGYDVKTKTLSPHRFGIPQIRERVFIVASRTPLDNFKWPDEQSQEGLSIKTILDENPPGARKLPDQVMRCLETWQDFLDRFPEDEELPTFPIWSMEFGATYPYEDKTPYAVGFDQLWRYKGNHGRALSEMLAAERVEGLPSYARNERKMFPDWKIDFIQWNREFYARHKRWIDPWMPKILVFPPCLQKLEWNCKGEKRDIWSYVIQFRASGVRVKRPTTAPALVAMTTTQVPIIAWERRYMTPRECARLQSLKELRHLPEAATKAYKALGNSINANVVELVAGKLLAGSSSPERGSPPARAVRKELATTGV